MAFCPTCGTQIADGASCPKCAGGTVQGGSTSAAGAGLDDNVAGALAYVTIIPAILFLVLEPFNRLIEGGHLMAYKYEGFWRAMDTLRDRQVLEDMVERGDTPWRIQQVLPDIKAA